MSPNELEQQLLAHYTNPDRENLWAEQLAEMHGVTLAEVKRANLNLLHENEITFDDIVGGNGGRT